MKTYKINNVEISEEQIKEIIKNNPELLTENKGGRYFFPERNEKYWRAWQDGSVTYESYDSDYKREVIPLGVYRTKEEAKLASAKQRAIVACWKWAQENAPFEPDWGDEEQAKYYVTLSHNNYKQFWVNSRYQHQVQFTLPHFKSREDCESFINANKEHLELLFTK